jgi:hypothetical protein
MLNPIERALQAQSVGLMDKAGRVPSVHHAGGAFQARPGERKGSQKEKLMQSELYRSIFAEGEQQGERKGLQQGLQQGLRQAIMDLCEILGIELTPERRAEIEQLDPTQLSQLRTHLKSARAWPLARP